MIRFISLKKLMLTGALLLTVAGQALADAEINFSTKSHDFGTIREEKGQVSYEFQFENSGDKPLVIVSANASCGCTKPVYPTEPIKPGKSGHIKVTYNPSGRPGEFSKTIKVRTNASKNKRVSLKITGTVVPANK